MRQLVDGVLHEISNFVFICGESNLHHSVKLKFIIFVFSLELSFAVDTTKRGKASGKGEFGKRGNCKGEKAGGKGVR